MVLDVKKTTHEAGDRSTIDESRIAVDTQNHPSSNKVRNVTETHSDVLRRIDVFRTQDDSAKEVLVVRPDKVKDVTETRSDVLRRFFACVSPPSERGDVTETHSDVFRPQDDSAKKVDVVQRLEEAFRSNAEDMSAVHSILMNSWLSSHHRDPFYRNLQKVIGLAEHKEPIRSWNEVKDAEKTLQEYQQYITKHALNEKKSMAARAHSYVEAKKACLPPFGEVPPEQALLDRKSASEEVTTDSTKEHSENKGGAFRRNDGLNTQDKARIEQHIFMLAKRVKEKEEYIESMKRCAQSHVVEGTDAITAMQPGTSTQQRPEQAPWREESDLLKRKVGRLEESLRQQDTEERNLTERRETLLKARDNINRHMNDKNCFTIYFRSYILRRNVWQKKLQNVTNELASIDQRLPDLAQERKAKQSARQALLYALGHGEQDHEEVYAVYLMNKETELREMQGLLGKVTKGEPASDDEIRRFKLDKVQGSRMDTPFEGTTTFQKVNEVLSSYPVPRFFDGLGAHPWIAEPIIFQGLFVTVALQHHGVEKNYGATILDREGGYGALGSVYLLNAIIHGIKGIAGYGLKKRYEQGLQKIKQSLTEAQFQTMKQLPEEQQWIIRRESRSQHSKKSPFKIDYDKAWNRYKALSTLSADGVLLPADNLRKRDLETWQRLKEALFLQTVKEHRGTKILKYAVQNVLTSVTFGGGCLAYAFGGLGIGAVPYATGVMAASAIKDGRYFKHQMRERHARAIRKREAEISQDITRLLSSSNGHEQIMKVKEAITESQPQKKTETVSTNGAHSENASLMLPDQGKKRVYRESLQRALGRTEEAMQEQRTFFSRDEKKQFVDDLYDKFLQKEQNALARQAVKNEKRSLRKSFNPDRDTQVQEKLDFCVQTTFEMVRNLLTASERKDGHSAQVSPNTKAINIHLLQAVSEKDALEKLAATNFTYTDPFQEIHGPEEVADAFLRYKTAMALLTDCGAIDAEKEMREKIRQEATSRSERERSKQSGNTNSKIPIHDMLRDFKPRLKQNIGGY